MLGAGDHGHKKYEKQEFGKFKCWWGKKVELNFLLSNIKGKFDFSSF